MNGATVSMFVIGAVIALVIALVVGAEIVTQTQSLVAEGSRTCPDAPVALDGSTTITAGTVGVLVTTAATTTADTSVIPAANQRTSSLNPYPANTLCTYDTSIMSTTIVEVTTAAGAAVVALANVVIGGPLGNTDGTLSLAATVVQFIPVLYFIGLFAIPAAIGFAAYKRFTA